MPLRRLLTSLGFGAILAAVAGACLPWSVSAPGLHAVVTRALLDTYGLALTTTGPTEVTLLPLPRVSFRDVRVAAGRDGGPALAEGGTLSLQLNLLALLTGRIDVHTLGLDGTTLRLPADDGDGRWAEPARLLRARLRAEGATHPRRISLSRTTVTGLDPRDGSPQTARDLDLTLSWPLWSTQADILGSFQWSAMPTRFSVAGFRVMDLLDGIPTPLAVTATWAAGSLTAEGNGVVRADAVALTGTGRFATRSLPETLDWAGGRVALSPFVGAFGIDGSFVLDGRQLLLPDIRVSFGDDRLEGAAAVTFGRDRPAVQATLAAETLNFAPALAQALRATGPDGRRTGTDDLSARALVLAPFTGGDLDLRISSAAVRLGPIQAEDVAASILVRAGSIEAALNRAALAGGTLKGRIALTASAADPRVTDGRLQGAFERIDLAVLPEAFRPEGWFVGPSQGQFQAEGSGADARAFLARLGGHAALSIENGALVGFDLAGAAQRGEPPVRRAGRTAFDRAVLSLRFRNGVAEIAEGTMEGASLAASLRGTVSLAEGRCETRLEVAARDGLPEGAGRVPLRLAIAGPFDDLRVRPLASEAEPVRDGASGSPGPLRPPVSGPPLPGGARAYAE